MVTQVLLRLPDDLAARLSHVVASRQRNHYLVELLRRELGRESGDLEQAARRLNEIEAKSAALRRESSRWVKAPLDPAVDDGFDAVTFERQFAIARKTRATAPAVNRAPAANRTPAAKPAHGPALKSAASIARRGAAARPRAISG